MSIPSPSSIWLALAAFAVTGCGTSAEYAYVPAAAEIVEGRAVGRFAVPAEAPAGRVEVEVFGHVELSEYGMAVPVLQLRLVFANERDDQPWVIDARHQRIEIPNQGRARALYASSDRELPVFELARGQQAMLELYVPMPGTVETSPEPSELDALWQVTTGTRIAAERTHFERVEVDVGSDPAAGARAGMLAFWWVDAEYDWQQFVDPPWIRVRPTTRVVVSRRPRQRWILRDHR